MRPAMSSSTEQFIRVTSIIAIALAASIPIYMVIALAVAPTSEAVTVDADVVELVVGVLVFAAAGNLVAAQIVFRRGVAAAEKHPTPEQRLGGYRIAVIIAFALREGVAIYGLVISFLSGDARWAVGFGAVALVSMFLGWPKREAMERLAAEVPPIV